MALKMNKPSIQFGGQTLLAIFLVISLVLMVAYAREGEDGPLHSLQDTVSAVSSPLSGAGATVGSLAVSASLTVEDLTASDVSMNQLRENNARLAQMVVELEEYRQEAARLEALVGLADAYDFSSVSARVVGYSADSYNRVVTLDVGSDAGVRVGLPVMGSTGVIGQVVSVTPLTCEVRLLNDAQSGVAVMIQSSRVEGLLTGSLDGTLYLEGVDDTVTVKEGDAIITSGLGGGYFRGLVVGTISKIEQRPGDATRTIVIAPNARFTGLSEVMVVLGMSNEGAANEDKEKADAVVSAVTPEALEGIKNSTTTPSTEGSTEGATEGANEGSANEGSANEGGEE